MLAFDTLFSCQGARFLARALSRSPGLKANAPTGALVRSGLERSLRGGIVAYRRPLGKFA